MDSVLDVVRREAESCETLQVSKDYTVYYSILWAGFPVLAQSGRRHRLRHGDPPRLQGEDDLLSLSSFLLLSICKVNNKQKSMLVRWLTALTS